MTKWQKAGATSVLIISSSLFPLIPQEMELMYSYEYDHNSPPPITLPNDPPPEDPIFEDTNHDGKSYISVFRDKKGNKVYVEITEQQYREMGQQNGYAKNPKKDDYISAIEFLTPKTDAAIALDATASGSVNASSLTYAHTVTGSNVILLVGARDLDNTLTGITYNGAALTKINGTISNGGNNISGWFIVAPSTGANNVVLTKSSGTSNVRGVSVSYSGAVQTSHEGFGTKTSGASTSFNQSTTTVAANSWVMWYLGNNAGAGVFSAGSGTNLRVNQGGFIAIMDSGATSTPPTSKTLNASNTVLPDVWGAIMISWAPDTGGGGSSPASVGTFYWGDS